MYTMDQASQIMGYHNLSSEQWDNLSTRGRANMAIAAGVINLEQLILLDRPEHEDHVCQLCGASGNDKRYLQLRCMYDVSEYVPEMTRAPDSNLFGMNICKACRSDLLEAMRSWRDKRVALRGTPMNHDGYAD